METVLEITKNGEYNNVQLKPKWNKKSLKFEGGIPEGSTATFEKVFEAGKAISSPKYVNKDGSPTVSYSCKAKDSNGTEVSFWLTEAEHNKFLELGPVGTVFRASTKKEVIINPANGAEIVRFVLGLQKV